MVTSTRPAEGKSSISTLMAVTFALNGSKVLMIDADLRRPAVHLRFRIGKGQGLSSVLSGKTSVREAIVPWADLPKLHILPSGPAPPLPSELLGSKQMEDMLTALRAEYDFVIIDTPPVLAVTDASILGRLTDATILIIRYGTAQRHVVQRCVDLLDRSGTHLLGVAVNAVDFKAPEYSEYYGRKYYEYYGERNPE
jgi:capsular exopolysaccharide synthesis family protein